MMVQKHIYSMLFFGLLSLWLRCQDVAYNDLIEPSYENAHNLAYEGEHKSAEEMLIQVLSINPNDLKAHYLLASTYSWSGQYDRARREYNKITSTDRKNIDVWVSAIKNELYAKNEATALGLANKALFYLDTKPEVARLRVIALERIENKKYPKLGWYNQETVLKTGKIPRKKQKKELLLKENKEKEAEEAQAKKGIKPKTPVDKEVQNNRISIRNAFTVFDQRYDPMIYSSISFKRQTLAGSIIPRINYSNRLGKHGIQYDLDFYPKFSKRFYAYINYGYSNSSIYPNHKMGGDLYVNLPWAMEFSAGGRYTKFETRNISVVTNSIGHYRGNYYFSLRSYITPKSNNLTRVSGNLLVRKYLKDADNYLGVNFGMGYSPELRQFVADGELLAETLLFIESERLSFEYQFTGKKSENIYKANMGLTRQELAFDSGNFFWAVSAGITYMVRF